MAVSYAERAGIAENQEGLFTAIKTDAADPFSETKSKCLLSNGGALALAACQPFPAPALTKYFAGKLVALSRFEK